MEEESLQMVEGGLAMWEEYKTVVRGHREANEKAKSSLDLQEKSRTAERTSSRVLQKELTLEAVQAYC